jgi:hypothetical protein
MRRFLRHIPLFLSLLSLAVLVATLLARAHAELQVTETNSPRYRVGAILPDNARFELGPGCYVRVLKAPSNITLLFEGDKSPNSPWGGTREKPQLPAC